MKIIEWSVPPPSQRGATRREGFVDQQQVTDVVLELMNRPGVWAKVAEGEAINNTQKILKGRGMEVATRKLGDGLSTWARFIPFDNKESNK